MHDGLQGTVVLRFYMRICECPQPIDNEITGLFKPLQFSKQLESISNETLPIWHPLNRSRTICGLFKPAASSEIGCTLWLHAVA